MNEQVLSHQQSESSTMGFSGQIASLIAIAGMELRLFVYQHLARLL